LRMLIQRTAALATEAYWLLYAVTEGWRGFATWWERMQAMPSYHEALLDDKAGQVPLRKPFVHPTEAKGTQSCDQSYGNCSTACHPVTKKGRINPSVLPNLAQRAESDRLLALAGYWGRGSRMKPRRFGISTSGSDEASMT
jgi:hypothetical protein